MMGRLKLTALDLEVRVGLGHSFSDDGFVEDALDHTLKLYKHYRRLTPLVMYPLTAGCFVRKTFFTKRVHIYYRHAENESENLFNRAHEETHALYLLGQLRLLRRALREKFGVKIPHEIAYPLREDEIEAVAEVGGVYALTTRNLPVDIDYINEGPRELVCSLFTQCGDAGVTFTSRKVYKTHGNAPAQKGA